MRDRALPASAPRERMPILVLSEIDDEETKIRALLSGADDYVTKPFSPGELPRPAGCEATRGADSRYALSAMDW